MITFLELMDALLIYFLYMTLGVLILILFICLSLLIFGPPFLIYLWIQDKLSNRDVKDEVDDNE